MTTVALTADSGTLAGEQALLRAKLARLRRRLRLQLVLETAVDLAALLALATALLVPLDYWFRPDLSARLALLAVAVAGAVAFLVPRVAKRWRASRLDDLAMAVAIDRHRPGTAGRVADVLQLPALLELTDGSASPGLVRLAVRRAIAALDASDWSTLWNRGRTATRGGALVAALAVPTAFAALAPESARLSLARWLLGSNERWPQKTYLSVVGLNGKGRLIAPRDEPFALEVRSDPQAVGPRDGRWTIAGRGSPLAVRAWPTPLVNPPSVRVRERGADGLVREAAMVATGPASFRYELPPSSVGSTIELTGGDDWLDPIAIDRVDRPTLTSTSLRAREASEADFKAVGQGGPPPAFLPDTEVELTLVGSESIAEARLTVHPGKPPALDRAGPTIFKGRWPLREATTLEIQVISEATGLASRPTFLSLGLLKDRVPRVTLRALGVGGHVTPVATIPLTLAATDDLGLAAVRIQDDRTTVPDDKSEPKTTRTTIDLPPASADGRAALDHRARHDVELQASPPAVGTILRFLGEAEDRCARGTQVGRSGVVQLQVVSPDELFYEILVRQRAERAKFMAALEMAENQGPALAGTPNPEAATAVMRAMNGGARQLEQIAGRVADSLQEMTLNQIGSPKSHRLLQEGVVEPTRALVAGPVARLRTALQTLAGSGRRPADEARALHGEVVTEMKAILEQMSQWESFVDVVNQVAEVIKMQRGVLDATETARDSRTQEVFDAKP